MDEREIRDQITVDKLNLLHPSLGLAFTSQFMLDRPQYLLQCNKAADQLPDGCDGCREEIGGRLICCVNQTDQE